MADDSAPIGAEGEASPKVTRPSAPFDLSAPPLVYPNGIELPTLLVLANPYAALDHNGVPCCTCGADPTHAPGEQRVIGAKIDTARTRVTENRDGPGGQFSGQSSPQETWWLFSRVAERIPVTGHYREQLRVGDPWGALIPCDEKTAKAADRAFVDPAVALRQARSHAIAAWTTNYGEPPLFARNPQFDPYAHLDATTEA